MLGPPPLAPRGTGWPGGAYPVGAGSRPHSLPSSFSYNASRGHLLPPGRIRPSSSSRTDPEPRYPSRVARAHGSTAPMLREGILPIPIPALSGLRWPGGAQSKAGARNPRRPMTAGSSYMSSSAGSRLAPSGGRPPRLAAKGFSAPVSRVQSAGRRGGPLLSPHARLAPRLGPVGGGGVAAPSIVGWEPDLLGMHLLRCVRAREDAVRLVVRFAQGVVPERSLSMRNLHPLRQKLRADLAHQLGVLRLTTLDVAEALMVWEQHAGLPYLLGALPLPADGPLTYARILSLMTAPALPLPLDGDPLLLRWFVELESQLSCPHAPHFLPSRVHPPAELERMRAAHTYLTTPKWDAQGGLFDLTRLPSAQDAPPPPPAPAPATDAAALPPDRGALAGAPSAEAAPADAPAGAADAGGGEGEGEGAPTAERASEAEGEGGDADDPSAREQQPSASPSSLALPAAQPSTATATSSHPEPPSATPNLSVLPTINSMSKLPHGRAASSVGTKLEILLYGSVHGYERQQWRLHEAHHFRSAQMLQARVRGRTGRARARAEADRRAELRLRNDPRVTALAIRQRRIKHRLSQVHTELEQLDAHADDLADEWHERETARAQLHGRRIELETELAQLERAVSARAILTIQASFLRFKAILRTRRMRLAREERMARTIQRVQRGHVVRSQYRHLKAHERLDLVERELAWIEQLEHDAAVQVQRVARGMVVRRKTNEANAARRQQ